MSENDKGPLQEFYDVTTWLISTAPTARVDEGAAVPYHDALVQLTELRRRLRDTGAVEHNERWWLRHLKARDQAQLGGQA